jgi:CRP-like cAMP-binding protein
MPKDDTTVEDLADMLAGDYEYPDMVKECQQATARFLIALENETLEPVKWDRKGDPEDVRITIARYAKLLARLRGTVPVWRERSTMQDDELEWEIPIIEKSARRSATCLYNLARGHALGWRGETQISEEDIKVVAKVALSSAPADRVQALQWLIDGNGELTIQDMIDMCGMSYHSASRTFHTLRILGIIDAEIAGVEHAYIGRLKQEFGWLLDESRERLDVKLSIWQLRRERLPL